MNWFSDGQFERIHPDDVGKVVHVSEEFINHRSGYDVIFRSRHEDGYHYIHALGEWMTMPDGTVLAALMYTDISGNKEAAAAAAKEYDLFRRDLFFTDPVTGLPNINYLHKFADEKLHAMRVLGLKPALIYSDIKFMESYNNKYGFARGDDLLRLTASVLKDVFPDALTIRGYEDHFIVITPMTDRKQLGASVDEANKRIIAEAYGNTPGIQVGICEYENDMQTAEALDYARRAFRRMGKNLNTAWRFFSRDNDNLFWSRRYIVENFNKALENRWFQVYYQAIASVESRKAVALEALAMNQGTVPRFVPNIEPGDGSLVQSFLAAGQFFMPPAACPANRRTIPLFHKKQETSWSSYTRRSSMGTRRILERASRLSTVGRHSPCCHLYIACGYSNPK